jgi:hypothetical protein
VSLRNGVVAGPDRSYANSDGITGERLTSPVVADGTTVHADRLSGVGTAFDRDGGRLWHHVATAEEAGRAGYSRWTKPAVPSSVVLTPLEP